MLELNPDAASVCGVKLAPNQITVAVTNFQADVLNTRLAADQGRPAAGLGDHRPRRGRRAALRRGRRARRSRASAASASAFPASSSAPRASAATARSSASATSTFGADLQARLGIAVTVDSDVNLITLAEHWFGHGRGLDDFLVVSIEHTIGLGIMHGGELFRGANGLSPDLGDLVVATGGGRSNGALRRAASPRSRRRPSILAAAAELVRGTADGPLLRGARGIEHAVKLAAAGDKRIAKVFHDAGQALGIAIANLDHAVRAAQGRSSPARPSQAGDRCSTPLREAVASCTPKTLADVAEIVVARVGRRHLGARRGGADAARPLRRAVEHDGTGATHRLNHGREGAWSGSASASSAAAISARPISRRRRRFRSSTSGASPTSSRRPPKRARSQFGVPATRVEDLLADPADRDRRQSHRPRGACRGRA